VSSDGEEDLHIDDDESGDEKTEKEKTMTEEADRDIDPSSMLVASQVRCASSCIENEDTNPGQILTPADFKLLAELREQAAKAAPSGRGTKRKFVSEQQHDDHQITAEDITGPQKRTKADYAARVSSVIQGREGREKYSVPKKALRSKPLNVSNLAAVTGTPGTRIWADFSPKTSCILEQCKTLSVARVSRHFSTDFASTIMRLGFVELGEVTRSESADTPLNYDLHH